MFQHLHEVRKQFGHRYLREVHDLALEAVAQLRASEFELICCLRTVESLLVYRFLGYGSLWRYAVEALHLSEHQAFDFVTVARKTRQVPGFLEALERGDLTVSKARRLCVVINSENYVEWLEMAKSCTKRELEKAIAKVSPRAAVEEGTRVVDGDLHELRMAISEQNLARLKQAQNLISQARRKPVTLEETICEMSEFYLERKDPVRKAERAIEREIKRSAQTDRISTESRVPFGAAEPVDHAEQVKSVSNEMRLGPGRVDGDIMTRSGRLSRRKKKASVQHRVHIRDRNECQFKMPDGRRCGESRFIELHHRIALSEGGPDTPENLVCLCSAHHRLVHQQ